MTGEVGADEALVQIGAVRAFYPLPAGHDTARKLGEEVMEAFSAWEDFEAAEWELDGREVDDESWEAFDLREAARGHLANELADVVQCVANLTARIGVTDMRPLMAACEVRNRARGRIL